MTDLELDACPECDLLLHSAAPSLGEKAYCPRCGYLIQRPRKQSIERTFALACAGLILFIPANLLPIIGIKMLGNSSSGTLWSGVSGLFAEGLWAVATLVMLASMLFPLINILLSLLISAHLYFQRPSASLSLWMRLLQHLTEWSMLEVYTLGIIVACVKLSAMSDILFGFGLYAFLALLIVNVMLTSSLDPYLFWRQIAQLKSKAHDQ